MLLAMFIIGIVPVSFAQETDETRDVEDVKTVEEVKIIDTTTETDIRVLEEKRVLTPEEKMRLARLRAMHEKARMMKKDVRDVRVKAERMETKMLDIRAHMREKFQRAIAECEAKGVAPERCKAMLEKRMALVDKLTDKDLERLKNIDARRKAHIDELEDIREDKEFRKYRVEKDAVRARSIAKDRIENAREDFAKAKDRYKDAREKLNSERTELKESRDAYKECADKDSTECDQKKKDAITHAKRTLTHMANAILEHLEKAKQRINEAEDLSEEEAKDLLTKIENHQAAIKDSLAKIDALPEDATPEQIREVAKTIKDMWKEIRSVMKKTVGRLVNAKVGAVIVRSRHLQVDLDRVLARMAEAGKDTSAVESLVDQFNTQLSESKLSYEKAQELFRTDKVDEAQRAMSAAHNSVKQAHQTLMQIFRTLKSQGESVTPDSDEASEAEEEAIEDQADEADDNADDEADEEDEEESEDGEEESEDNEDDEEAETTA